MDTLSALLYGVAASSALIIGSVVGARWSPPRQLTAVLLAFASGALISALAFELFEEAYARGGAWRSGIGLLAGAATFVLVDTLLERRVAAARGARADVEPATGSGSSAPGIAEQRLGWALLAAVTLDGVPENLALGVSLVEGSSITLLVAIFASNLPEALVGAVAMRDNGRSRPQVVAVWTACAVLLTLAVLGGRVLGGGLDDALLSVALGYAGGAVLASLADTLMPEAFEQGRPYIAFATAAGFFLSYVLAA